MSERKIKLQIKDMTKKYDNGDGVEHINLDIYEGEIVTFLGFFTYLMTAIFRQILHRQIWRLFTGFIIRSLRSSVFPN